MQNLLFTHWKFDDMVIGLSPISRRNLGLGWPVYPRAPETIRNLEAGQKGDKRRL
jgi:hypothetical protein